jgi:hypothetical protein
MARLDEQSGLPMLRRVPRAHSIIVMLSAVALVTSACASPDEGLSPVLFTPELPARGPTIVVVPSRDARVFTNASHPAPKPSLRGDVDDTQLSSRVLGRHLSSNGMLGANVVLESGITVSDLVDQAIVAGLRNAGIRATVEESGARTHQAARALHTTIYEFWLYRRKRSGPGTISYRVSLDVSGQIPGDGGPTRMEVEGSLSAGGVNLQLWRRAVEQALEEVSTKLGQRIRPLATRPGGRAPGGRSAAPADTGPALDVL